ncbi:MAG TPA: DNA translocase FtsK 4TM domain-containing protein [Bacteroidota bacterium]|nr:DNA translocase FtsK 4TM domain-containing protein [Bacteroidota bacterium]
MEETALSTEQPVPRRKKSDEGKKSRRNKQIGSFLLMVLGLLVLLSLISYSAIDEASGDLSFSQLARIVSNDPVIQAKAAATHNWLGLVGAIISNFLINSTVGFGVFVLPFLLLAWGWTTLRRGNVRRLMYFTNYVVVIVLLLSTFFGLLRIAGMSEILSPQWSGVVGAFLSNVLGQLVGSAGAIIITVSLLFVAVTLAIDLDLHVTSERVKDFFLMTGEIISGNLARWKEKRAIAAAEKERQRASIEVRRPAEELVPRAERPAKTKEPVPAEPVEEEASEEIPPPPEERQPESGENPAGEPSLDIKEMVKDEEVDLEERDVEDEEIDYVFPSVDLLTSSRQAETIDDAELKANAELLRAKLADFDVEVANVSVTPGPVVTLYELVPATGVKVAKIVNLSNDLALAMQAKGIRIEAPIPGKGTVGVEIPNHKPSMVTIRSIINSTRFRDSRAALPLAMGKTISGEVYVDDLSKMPHLLIAGSTGSGKSVGINTIITSLLYRLHPSEVKFLIVDPKKIELSLYRKLEHHFLAVSKDIDEKIITMPQNAVLALKAVELEMEQRYDKLAHAGVRNIADYNERITSGRLKDSDTVRHRKLPYIIIIIDELADLMITAAREVEEPITRLAQLARAVGIHLVVATQRPSVDVITGVIKANFPARIAYQVSSKTDSRTILDMNGAEQLLGNGDMLYLPSSSPKPIRIQNAFISSDEVESIADHIGKQRGYSRPFELPSVLERQRSSAGVGGGARDELFVEAARTIVRHQQGSVSLLQRRLKVGYSRAARLVDELEAAGIVGPFDGSKAREVLIESDAALEVILKDLL